MLRIDEWSVGNTWRRLRSVWPILALALAVVALPALRASAQEDEVSTLQRNRVSVDGQYRNYYYYVSSKADPHGFNLVVYALHDNGQSVQEFAQQSGWLQVAEQNGFVVVFPEGQGRRWLTDAGNEDDYLKAVFDDAKAHMRIPGTPPPRIGGPEGGGGEGAAGPPGAVPPLREPPPARDPAAARTANAGNADIGAGLAPIGPVHTWLPFQYLTGVGAGATVAQSFAMNHPDLFAAVATLDGAPYSEAYDVANQPADGSTLRMWVGWDVKPVYKPLKKDVPVDMWLFTTGAPSASELKQADYWKQADGVGAGTTRAIGGFQTVVYRNGMNPDQQVRTTVVPAGTKYDGTIASAMWDHLFSHVARFPDTPNGDIGRILTPAQVQQQFKIRTLTVDGQTYTYYLNLPPNWRKGRKLPLVLAAHGGGYPPWLYLSQVKMHEVGQKEGFMTVYLQAPGYVWHFTDPEGANSQYIQKVIADVEANFGADKHRIYMQGFSLGSGMTYMMGISHPQLFAAISPNSGIGPMSDAVEARVSAIKAKQDIRLPVIIPYGVADHGGSIDGQIPADGGVLHPAFNEWKAFNHITTPDRVEPYDSPSSAPYNILVPGGKLVHAAFDQRYPDGRFTIYEYYSDDPKPLNLFDFVWIADMAHCQDPREAQLEWDYFKHWRRNDNGTLTYMP